MRHSVFLLLLTVTIVALAADFIHATCPGSVGVGIAMHDPLDGEQFFENANIACRGESMMHEDITGFVIRLRKRSLTIDSANVTFSPTDGSYTHNFSPPIGGWAIGNNYSVQGWVMGECEGCVPIEVDDGQA